MFLKLIDLPSPTGMYVTLFHLRFIAIPCFPFQFLLLNLTSGSLFVEPVILGLELLLSYHAITAAASTISSQYIEDL